MAEWLRRGLQNLVHRFNSGSRLQSKSQKSEARMSSTLYFQTVAQNFQTLAHMPLPLDALAAAWIKALQQGNKILFCGNGGSAADAQHLAAELVGRFKQDRRALAGLALTVDTSALTAIGNDYGYEEVFARQLRGLGKAGDVLVGFSTSGNSPNVVKALAQAREMGIVTAALTGSKPAKMHEYADFVLAVPSDQTNHIQEMHIAIGHWLCTQVDLYYLG